MFKKDKNKDLDKIEGTLPEPDSKSEEEKKEDRLKEIKKKKNKRRKDKALDELKYIVPMTLRKSIAEYGYRMDVKKFIAYYVLGLLAVFGAAYMFRLKILFIVVLAIEVIAVIPLFVHDKYKRQHYLDEFENASRYAENILYAFNKTGKILDSLKEVLKIFPEGKIHDCIQKAIKNIEDGAFYDEEQRNMYVTALEHIEKEYPAKRILSAHRLMTSTELNGGEYHDTVKVLLNDRRTWDESTKRLMKQKSIKFGELVLSAVVAAVVCLITCLVYKMLPEDMNITTALLSQVGSLFMLFSLVLLIKFGSTKLTTNWVKLDALDMDEDALEDYEYIINYDEAKARKKSIIYSIPFFIGAVCIYMLNYPWYYTLIVGGIGVLCLFMPRLGYRAYYKSVVQNIKLTFPTWLLQMNTLLKGNNVANSLIKSMDEAPALFVPEIQDLLTRISENPGDVRTYTAFFGYFDIPEIRSAMNTLFTIAESGNNDIEEQMQTLLDMTYYMQQQAEEILAANTVLAMKNLFQVPMLIAAIKLVADLLTFIIVALPALATLE